MDKRFKALVDGSWEVTLEPYELRMACLVGIERLVQVIARDNRVPLKDDDAGFNKDLNGACGEAAFAKFRNVWWDGSVNTFSAFGDVGGAEVRTRTKHDWQLFVRPADKDERYFVLVTGRPPTYRVQGWILGADAKQPEWMADPGGYGKPAFFPPTAALTRFRP